MATEPSMPAEPSPLPLVERARRVTQEVVQAVVCGRTAAHIWGLEIGATAEPGWPIELTAPAHLALPNCVTYLAPLPRDDITLHRGIRLTTRERTALDCARRLPRLEAVAILDQFARRGVDLEALWHRPLNSWALRDTLSLADRGAASPRESWLRVILVEGGLPRPTTQIRVDLGEDRFAYLDLGWEEFKVAVEYDGQEHHTSPADRQHDADRRDELRRKGWRVIAVRRDVIPAQTADLLEHVANALIERGWRPGPEVTKRILTRIRAARRKSRHRLPTHRSRPRTGRDRRPTPFGFSPFGPTLSAGRAYAVRTDAGSSPRYSGLRRPGSRGQDHAVRTTPVGLARPSAVHAQPVPSAARALPSLYSPPALSAEGSALVLPGVSRW